VRVAGDMRRSCCPGRQAALVYRLGLAGSMRPDVLQGPETGVIAPTESIAVAGGPPRAVAHEQRSIVPLGAHSFSL